MPAWELADLLPRQISTIKEIRLYLFSDAAVSRLELDTARAPIHGVPVTQHVWDLERLGTGLHL